MGRNSTKENVKTGISIGGVLFIACMFIGARIGMAYNSVPIGSAIGIVIGLIAMRFVWLYYTKRKS